MGFPVNAEIRTVISTFWMCLQVAVGQSLENVGIGNYSGIITHTGASYQALSTQADYSVPNNGAAATTLTCRMGFQLIDGGGGIVAGETFTTPFTLFIPAGETASGTQSVSLASVPLVADAPYRVVARLYRQTSPTTYAGFGVPVTGSEYRWKVVDAGSSAGVVAWVNTPLALARNYAVATIAAGESFQVAVQGVIGRLDLTDAAVTSDNYNVYLDATITGDQVGDVPLVNARTTLAVALANHTAAGGPAAVALNQTLDLQPLGQLDSTDSYTITIVLRYAGPDNAEVLGYTASLGSQTLLHFNGTLLFGSTSTQIQSFEDSPVAGAITFGTSAAATIAIPPGGAVLTGQPAFTFTSDPGTLQVLLLPDGTAQAIVGAVTVSGPGPTDTDAVNGITFSRTGITLDPDAGIVATLSVTFPAGFGVANGPGKRRLRGNFPVNNVALDGSLRPSGVMTLSPSAISADQLYAVHEDLPLAFASFGIDWDVGAGTLTVHRISTYNVRAYELNQLDSEAATLDDPSAAIHPSNDGYFRNPASDAGLDIVITADAQGRAVLTTAQIDLPPSNFTAHFPAGTNVAWTQPGVVVISNGAIDATQSSLPGASDAVFTTSPGAPSNPSPVASDAFTFTPGDAAWTFTTDGGLHAEGGIVAAPLRWGARDAAHFASVTDNFTSASAHLPGPVLRGTDATTTNDNRPGELLLSGHGQPGDASYIERCGAANYLTGLADYAGVNFRVAADGTQNATSLIGNASVGPYPLRGTCKYYARTAGISGIHEAVTSAFAAQAGGFVVYGFALSLNNYQLALRDNAEVDSLVSGTVNVPGAHGQAGFAQPFDKMKFTSKGDPSELILPDPNSFEQTLAYWNAKLYPATVEFQPHPTIPSLFALVFGGDVLLSGVVKDPIHGALGFLPSGQLVAAANGFPGVNSRLKPPKLLALHGTGSYRDPSLPGFNVHPVSDIYFNDPNAAGAPDAGFVAFAGTVDVPFFQDLRVHVLARANGGSTSVRAGWSDGTGANFFNNAKFDSSNRGFPPGITCAQYENDTEPNDYFDPNGDAAHQTHNPYNVMANQSWLHFVDFAMPVTWDPALRRFVSSLPEQRDFLVLNSQRVLKQLTPSGAEIRFGLQFNNIPRLNLASLVIDEQEVSNELINLIPNGPDLVAGTQAFKKLLNNQSDDLINAAVSAALDGVINAFFDQLTNAGAHSAQDAVNQLNALIGVAGDSLRGQMSTSLGGIIGDVGTANTVMNDFSDALTKINAGLGTADQLLAKDGNGKRGAFVTSTVNLALQTAGVPANERAQITDPVDTLINGDLRSTLDDVQDAVQEVHSLSNSAQGLVNDVRGVTQAALDTANAATGLPDQVLGSMRDYLANAAKNDPTGQYLSEVDLAKLKSDLKTAAMDAIRQSGFVADLQGTIRDAVEPLHDEYAAAFDQIFGVLNDVVHSALQEVSDTVVDQVNENLGKINRTVGQFSDTLKMTKVTGDAHIIGDVLDSAHIDSDLSLHVGGEVSLRGTLDFKRYHGDQPQPGCAIGGSPDGRMQITLGGDGNSSIAGCPPVHVKALGQYTMTASGNPLAVSGALSVEAGVHFDILSLKDAEFDFAFGALDNYIYTDVAGSILIFDADVKAFMGRTSDPAVLQKTDPLLGDVFAKLGLPAVSAANPMTGFYFNAVGDVALNRLLGIPDDVVTLKGRGGQGRFAFVNDRFADPSQFKVIPGMRWDVGLTVGIGPVTAGAELTALGGLDPLGLLQTGNAADIALSLFNPLNGGIHGDIASDFSVSGPFGFKKDFHFNAQGNYLPLPPPGTFFVNKLDF